MYQDKALRESFKLWEKFATGYTEVMTEAFQQTVKQSETFQKQVAEAVEQVIKPWWMMGLLNHVAEAAPEKPASVDQEQLVQTMMALQAQIATLTNKVSKLEEALTTLAQTEPPQP